MNVFHTWGSRSYVIAGWILAVYIALAITTAALVVKPVLNRAPDYKPPRELTEACKQDSPDCDARIIQFIRQNSALLESSRTTHRVYWADSDKYMRYADKLSFSRLITFSYNALGPALLVFTTGGNNTIISGINCTLLALTLVAAWHRLPVNPLIFVVWVITNPMLFFSLTSVDKEILAFSSLAFAAIFIERSGWQYLSLSLVLAALARWPQFILLLAFFTVRWLNMRLSRPARFMYVWLALALILASIVFPMLRQQPALHRFFLTEQTWAVGQMQRANGLLATLNSLQAKHWYGLLIAIGPKVMMQWAGNIFRVGATISGRAPGLNYNDIYNTYVVLGHQLWMTVALVAVIVMRRIKWSSYMVQLIACFAIFTASIPFINYRLMFPLVALLAIQLAGTKSRDGAISEAPAQEPGASGGKPVLVTWSSDFWYPQVERRCTLYLNHGHRVLFAGCDRNRTHARSETINGVRCEYLVRGRGYHSLLARLTMVLWVIRLFWYALRVDVSLIHVFDFDSALPVALACRLRGTPFIYDVLDNYELRYRWPVLIKGLICRLDRMIARWASAIVVPDENRIIGAIGSQKEKITVVYVCPPDYGIPKAPDPTQPFTIYAMGFLGRRRGIGLLLDAARALPNIRFLLAGNFLEHDLAESAGSLSNVRYVGYVRWPEATELAWESDIVFAFFDPAYESNRRAAAQKWFEAMMTGRPILGNSEIMRAEWIERERIGFSCPYDAGALQAKILELANNRQECRLRGAQGRRLFEEEFNWPLMENRLYTAIQRAVPALEKSGVHGMASSIPA